MRQRAIKVSDRNQRVLGAVLNGYMGAPGVKWAGGFVTWARKFVAGGEYLGYLVASIGARCVRGNRGLRDTGWKLIDARSGGDADLAPPPQNFYDRVSEQRGLGAA